MSATPSSAAAPSSAVSALSTFQKIFLTVIVPALMLLLLETVCRVFNLPGFIAKHRRGAITLDMPTWMQREDNTRIRASKVENDWDAIDWMNIFESAPGFRVRMVPYTQKFITNTFSQIEADKNHKYFVAANSLGFRGPEISPKKPMNTFRILVFGDSSSFGWGVNQDESFSALLQQELGNNAAGKKIEVGNFAIPGDSSEYGRLIVDKFIKRYESDLVIFGFGANDAKRVFVPHKRQVEKFRSSGNMLTLDHLARSSSLYETLAAFLTPSAKPPPSSGGKLHAAVLKRRYQENLLTMADQALNAGAKNVLLLSLCTPDDYTARARRLAERRHYMFLDGQGYLLGLLPQIMNRKVHPEIVDEMQSAYPADLKRNSLFYVTSDACHPNKLGHALIAEKLSGAINKAALIR